MQVMAAQANFVRVKVDSVEGAPEGAAPPRARLLCVVRGLLKKIKQNVLVGDRVRVVGIDWTDGRGAAPSAAKRIEQELLLGALRAATLGAWCQAGGCIPYSAMFLSKHTRCPAPTCPWPQAWWRTCCLAAASCQTLLWPMWTTWCWCLLPTCPLSSRHK